jgi:hypothetical protein
MDVTEPFGSHPSRTVVAGLALDGRDDAPLALSDLLANAFEAHLALVHAYPYESLGRVTDDMATDRCARCFSAVSRPR